MNEAPSVTIVTVTYNAEETLPPTLESVAAQTYPHVEHLIMDGCSTDRTMELIHRYVDEGASKSSPHFIRVLREPDRGLYDAMNKALKLASGQYVVFLNAGDRLHASNTLQRIFSRISPASPLPAVLYGETDWVDARGRFLRHRRLRAPGHLTWKDFRNGMLVCHQSFYARTDLAAHVPYDTRYRFSADYDWCIRLLKRAERLALPVCDTGLVLTDYLREGLTTCHHRESLWERFRIMARHYGWFVAVAEHCWFVVRAVLKR